MNFNSNYLFNIICTSVLLTVHDQMLRTVDVVANDVYYVRICIQSKIQGFTKKKKKENVYIIIKQVYII